jgi:4-aminobutyrate aminotransferase-like enzyme
MDSNRPGPSSYFHPDSVDRLDATTGELVRRRQKSLGPAYRLFYEHPVQLVRGSGVHLYDADGVEYLDVYNNVPSVGHAHPRVTAAIAEQAARLNTHTRYLHQGIIDYSEDLLSTFPGLLGQVMYTCTGSEANDLALRIAKHRTGNTGIIVTRNGYHGVTTETARISPSLGGLSSLAPWVRVIDAPDLYCVEYVPLGYASLADWFAGQVTAAIADLALHGIGLAAFIADSIFASDGVLPGPPDGLLAATLEAVHRAGGLYIADEVQPGFGRTGRHMWGFERHGTPDAPFLPDIVTIGKPMGNGMPIAATILRPEITEEFGREIRYFNTFGGNPVSIAAAQATLDVLRDEHLQQNATDMGEVLISGLRELATRHSCIGDVRGAGLFIGIELINPDETVQSNAAQQPNEQLTLFLVNELRRRHILIGTAGLRNNVLKVRPPLTFAATDSDRFLTELDGALRSAPLHSG